MSASAQLAAVRPQPIARLPVRSARRVQMRRSGLLAILVVLVVAARVRLAVLPHHDQPAQHRQGRRDRRHRRGRRDDRHHRGRLRPLRRLDHGGRRHGRGVPGRTRASPLPVAFAAALGIGRAVGLVNGAIISYARINPLIATLATLAIVRGLGYVISGGREMVIIGPGLARLGTGTLPRHPLHRPDSCCWRVPRRSAGRCRARCSAVTRMPSARARVAARWPACRWIAGASPTT